MGGCAGLNPLRLAWRQDTSHFSDIRFSGPSLPTFREGEEKIGDQHPFLHREHISALTPHALFAHDDVLFP